MSSSTENKNANSGEVDPGEAANANANNDADADSPQEWSSLDLGKLNRHWYRRCLDSLDEQLRNTRRDPSVYELEHLCDEIITNFLKAVTGQAPDSSSPQFPADRAYFIPFEGDNASEFNFSSCYYQYPTVKEDDKRRFSESIWTFRPWPLDANEKIQINQTRSVRNSETISFEEMISVREQFRKSSDAGADGTRSTQKDGSNADAKNPQAKPGAKEKLRVVSLRKSLLMRGDQDGLLDQALRDERLSEWHEQLRTEIAASLAAILDIYRLTPGNAGVETILMNQFHVIRWLTQLLNRERGDASATVSLQLRTKQYQDTFRLVLASYFLSDPWGCYYGDNQVDVELIENLMTLLKASSASKDQPEFKAEGSLRDTVISGLLMQEDSWFSRRDEDDHEGHLSEDYVADELRKLQPLLISFRDDFLTVDTEARLNQELDETLSGNPMLAGNTRDSFVWVCPDFAEIDEGLDEGHSVQKLNVKTVKKRSAEIVKPYVDFFRCMDVVQLGQESVQKSLKQYWRTLGDAAREDRVFGSFNFEPLGITTPDLAPLPPVKCRDRKFVDELTASQEIRPQNIFLRVCVRDSQRETVINGLFVFTADHDEAVYKGESEEKRSEDVEDLLAFAKVYFFIVRDYLHGLDRARVAVDVGRLNQDLYDKSLSRLDLMMERRQDTEAFIRDGLMGGENWDKFFYEVLNAYAYALIEKPPEVRQETFPFDRMLVVPLTSELNDSDYSLPFFYFQGLFLERSQGRILGSHYALLKPFQSPIETIDQHADLDSRFSVQSFQQASRVDGDLRSLDKYLEKHFVGAHETKSDRPASFVAKAVPANESDQYLVPHDRGKVWATWVARRFWVQTAVDGSVDLWLDFLRSLTADYRIIVKNKSDESDAAGTQSNLDVSQEQWFLVRFALLRNILQTLFQPNSEEQHEVPEDWTTTWAEIERRYTSIWTLEFDRDSDFHMIRLAFGERDPFVDLETRLSALDGSRSDVVPFVWYDLKNDDPFVLEFFKCLTSHMCNKFSQATDQQDDSDAAGSRGCKDGSPAVGEDDLLTWYQPVLTRPIDHEDKDREDENHAGEGDAPKTLHERAGERIGKRIPPYDKIVQGKDQISSFVGIVNVKVGGGTKDVQRVRYAILMARDFDDMQTGRVESKEQAKLDLLKDIEDLQLFTSTYFRNVGRFTSNALSRRRIEVLSTDVTQIARNWYSSGVDSIIEALQKQLKELMQRAEQGGLGELPPEIVECFFASIVDVLLRQENRAETRQAIELESFPFDRILHIPLSLQPSNAARLSYARTTVTANDSNSRWACDDENVYAVIRELGRTWDRMGGRKELFRSIHHLGQEVDPARPKHSESQLFDAVQRLADARFMDTFARSLYEADALQTLAIAGTIYHFLQGVMLHSPERWQQRSQSDLPLHSIVERLGEVLASTLGTVDRLGDDKSVETQVHMDASVRLAPLGNADDKAREILGNTGCLPFWRELIRSLDGDEHYKYGLGEDQSEGQQTVKSKVFYVYYSIAAPTGIADLAAEGGRYRGVFCLLLDDISTDPKDEQGNVADQQDIRTFIHNSAGSLRLILEQQALHNEMLKPGVDQFVLGMLHRLKNKLGIPLVVLGDIDRALRAPDSRSEDNSVTLQENETTRLIEYISQAKLTIADVEDLFKNMKQVSDSQHSTVPLETFSSDWLGWQLIASLSEAAVTLIRGTGVTGGNAAALEKIARLAKANVESYGAADPHAKRSVQSQLARMQQMISDQINVGRSEEEQVELVLSYDVFNKLPLHFYGSHELPEALNILFENAFQALWSFVHSDSSAKTAKFEVVCRERNDMPGEILIEIQNNSEPIRDDLLKQMIGPVARPISAEQHKSSSGKKRGSGFGHFHARQVVMEFCGGRANRRKLDVKIGNLDGEQVGVTVNLLQARGNQPCGVELDEIVRAALGVFRDKDVGNALKVEPSLQAELSRDYYFPADLDPHSLFEIVNRLLRADRAAVYDSLRSSLQTGPCEQMRQTLRKLVAGLIARAESLLENDEGLNETERLTEWLSELHQMRKYRQGAVNEFIEMLQSWWNSDADLLRNLLAKDGLPAGLSFLQKTTGPFLNGDCGLHPVDLVTPKESKAFLKQQGPWGLAEFLPHLCRPASLYEVEEVDGEDVEWVYRWLLQEVGTEEFAPVTIFPRIVSAFREEKLDCHVKATSDSIQMSFRLSDGMPAESQSWEVMCGDDHQKPTPNFANRFAKGGLARVFQKYVASIESMSVPKSCCSPKLWFESHQADSDGEAPCRIIHLELPAAVDQSSGAHDDI